MFHLLVSAFSIINFSFMMSTQNGHDYHLGTIHLWSPRRGGSGPSRRMQAAVSSIWTSTQKIRAHIRHPVFSCKEVGISFTRISSL